MRKRFLPAAALLLQIVCFAQPVKKTNDPLYAGFLQPPNSAKPRVWWHWMNGNISTNGIAKDLQWMHRAGIGGFQNFDASLATPQVVPNRLSFMTPEWKNAFRFTTKLADSLKLEMAIAGSPGWSESGGPWVAAADGMKKIVWSETMVNGGTSDIALNRPPGTTGPFQNLARQEGIAGESAPANIPAFYKDIAVIAYKLPAKDISMASLQPVVSSSGGNFNLSQLTDGDLASTQLLPSDTAKGFAWIQFAFAQPQTIKAITVTGGGDKGPFGLNGDLKDTRSLQVSDDGINFKQLCFIPAGNVLQQTICIPVTTARYFRVTFVNPPAPFNFGAMLGGGAAPKAPAGTAIAEIVLHTATRINMFEEKVAFAPAGNLYEKASPATEDGIQPADIIDVTGKMDANGKLHWTVPAGNWNIVWFGYSLMGINNHPASPEATGLEVDKLDAAAVKRYFTQYLNQYSDATGGLMGSKGGLQFMVTDSWEAGAQNWTGNMLQEFQHRRGYSMLPWMPVLTGRIVNNTAASEQFLWDYRKTISEMLAAYHYDQLTDLLQQYGMKRYSESHENGRTIIADGMEVKRRAAVPMSAMWTPGGIGGGENMHKADIRESASVAHIYGQNLVAAESLTALGMMGNAWSYSPEKLKPTADMELASGLNRFVIHTSVHQPLDDKIPGLGLGPFGQWFTRHETWAEQAGAWTGYLARSCYMLQQGKMVADIAWYYGEDNNITSLFGTKPPAVPEGYNFDYVNADALVNVISGKDGSLVTPGGMRYRVLVLDSNARYMSLPVLRKLKILVNAGVPVTGVQPIASPSLADDPKEFASLVAAIWNDANKKVFVGKSLEQVLASLQLAPDFSYAKPQPSSNILYVHRKLPEGDVYWVNNRSNTPENIEALCRVEGRRPEIWDAATGARKSISYNTANGITKLQLQLQGNDAFFIVFREKAPQAALVLPAPQDETAATLNGVWTIDFQKDRGAPASVKVNGLQSWTENPDAGIKYFSGTARYTFNFEADRSWLGKDRQYWIDLGMVKNIAEVSLNGKPLGIAWKFPFRLPLDGALQAGTNKLEVKVTNLWVNRLIGDQQPGTSTKITYTTMPFYQAGSPLLPSGLLGPVTIHSLK